MITLEKDNIFCRIQMYVVCAPKNSFKRLVKLGQASSGFIIFVVI